MLGTLPNWTVKDIGGDEGGSSPRLKMLMLLRKVIGVEKQTEEIDPVYTHLSKYTIKGHMVDSQIYIKTFYINCYLRCGGRSLVWRSLVL